jgi:imidazolonepropionase-like amidohydrolase
MLARMVALIWFLALMCCAPAAAQGKPSEGALVFVNANVLDGVSAEPLRGAAVFVRGGKIEKIVPGKPEIAPGSYAVVDLGGRWLLPGFLDAHAHIADLGSARRALLSGATTVRVLGVPHFADVGLRELHRGGFYDLPEILAAGYHLRPRLAQELFLDLPHLREFFSGVAGAEGARRVVRAQAEKRLDWIKINTTERAGLPQDDPLKRLWKDEEISAIVDEAARHNLPVAAHAHGDEGAAAAVRAGVRTLEHGTYLSEATLRLMKEKGVCYVPTVATIVDMADPQGEDSNAALAVRGRAMVPRLRETVRAARRLGVKIVAATDTGYSEESVLRMPAEIIELVRSGLTPAEAIAAATSVAAECLGAGARTGAIRSGLEADLVVVERDPQADPEAVREILVVVNNGRIVLNRIHP